MSLLSRIASSSVCVLQIVGGPERWRLNFRPAAVARLLLCAALGCLAVATLAAQKVQVNIACSRDVAPGSRIQVQINTQNAPTVHLQISPIDGERWIKVRLLSDDEPPAPRTIGGPVADWDARIASAGQVPDPNDADTFYSRQINLPALRPGVYLIRASAGRSSAWAVANVTNLGIVVKRSPKRMLVWVTDANTGALKPGAHVAAFTKSGSEAGQAKTGPDGAALFPIGPGDEAVLVSSGTDLAGVATGASDPDGRLVAHFQTDRPIYRSGQTVSFKAILRRTLGQGYAVVADKSVTVGLRDPKDDLIDQKRMTTNPMGSIAESFDIPSEAMSGNYTLTVTQGKDQIYQTFQVAEYRKPEFQVSVIPVKKRYLDGETVEFTVQASYYFGAPVPNATVKFLARMQPNPYFGGSSRGFDDGNLYPSDTYASNEVVGDDTVQTDKNGRATISLNTRKTAPDSVYTVAATVIDASRRQVEAEGDVPVYAASKRVGLRTDVIVATLGSLIPVEIRVVDLDDAPATATVRLRVLRSDWDEKKEEQVFHVLVDTRVLVPPTGKTRYNLPAREEGDLIIQAICDDGTGRRSSAQIDVEVAGNYGRNTKKEQQPSLDIRLDRSSYAPGNEAHAYVTTNKPGHAVLLVAEGQDIWSYRVLSRGRAGQLWTVGTSKKMVPNAVLTACEWVDGELVSGNSMLLLPDRSRHLFVTVIPDRKSYSPGDKASMTVRVRDAQGNPVRGEISLAVVDEAIYAVSADTTPDPYDTFWSPREDLVSMTSSSPEDLSGGAYQAAAPGGGAPIRSRFADTALWAGIVATDRNGEARLNFEMPGNLTTWRATAYGIDVDTSAGKGVSSVIANRAVMLRLATPRLLVVGDRLTLIGSVNNRTDSPHEFRVRLKSEGITLQGAAEQTVHVDAKGEGHVEWVLNPTKLPDGGLATLTGDVVATDHPSADLGDALRVTVPVVPKAVRERILTGGVLGQSARFVLRLPAERAEPATIADIEVKGNLADVVATTSKSVFEAGRYGAPVAIDQLAVAAATKQRGTRKEVRDSLAMLARDQTEGGWGWWQGSPVNPAITARALRTLAEALKAGLPVYLHMYQSAVPGVESLYGQVNLWDSRALLAAALTDAGSKKAADLVAEVQRRGQDLSPFARLRLAEAENGLGHEDEAKQLLSEVIKLASRGADSSYMPVGDGLGWSASSTETTAEALFAMVKLRVDSSEQAKMARWLALSEDDGWRTLDEDTAIVRALAAYTSVHKSAETMGQVSLTVNGVSVPTIPAKVGQGATARIPRQLLRDGENVIVLGRTEPGETFVSIDARVYLPRLGETTQGVRVLRRIEVQNGAGIWIELNRPVKAGEPVRITTVAWGDELPDAMRVIDPIPAGFEFVSDESDTWGNEEVRDGAVIHYLTNDGQPQTFRYYIRAESDGRLNVLPASAEFLRRPANSGQTTSVIVTVQK
jgi:uncharacterized protein YfaS (alpha-2-macroglobulin family)